jgi:hypothetical protein
MGHLEARSGGSEFKDAAALTGLDAMSSRADNRWFDAPISVPDLFTIGVGPSSSHTVGPMRAAFRFVESLSNDIQDVTEICVDLFGSRALTGKGHPTDTAVMLPFRLATGNDRPRSYCRLGRRNSLIEEIAAMRSSKQCGQTGEDMRRKYKETSLGVLAVNVVEC